MCVRTHVLFNSYLMYVNHFNIFFIPEVCSVTYTLLYIERRYRETDNVASGGWSRNGSSSWVVVQIRLFAHRYGDGLEAQIVFRQVDESLVAPVFTP